VPIPAQAFLWKHAYVLLLLAVASGCLLSAGGCNGLAAQGMNAEGVRLFEQARYEEAIDRFHKAISENPNNADGYYNLASAYHRLWTLNKRETDLKQADQYYRMCLDRNLNHRDCHRGLAVLMVEQGRREEAFGLLEEWAQREPTLPAPRIELARIYEEQGDLDNAKRYLLEALAVDHDNARALAALGRLREQTGETVQALADYQRSLWHDRFQPEVAARADALKAALNPRQMMTAPGGGTQIATGGATQVR